MKTKALETVLERVESWPADVQNAWAEMATEIEAEITGVYHPTAEELAAIDEARVDVAAGRIATSDEVDAIFAKHGRTLDIK